MSAHHGSDFRQGALQILFTGDGSVQALKQINLSIDEGEFVHSVDNQGHSSEPKVKSDRSATIFVRSNHL